MVRPRAIILFERILLAALALDLVNNFAAWPRFASKVAADGSTPSTTMLFIACVAPTLIGLAFWYLIARRGSTIAKWVMTVFVALATIGFVLTQLRGIDSGAMATFAFAAIGEALKIVAVALLFTRDAASWFDRPKTA